MIAITTRKLDQGKPSHQHNFLSSIQGEPDQGGSSLQHSLLRFPTRTGFYRIPARRPHVPRQLVDEPPNAGGQMRWQLRRGDRKRPRTAGQHGHTTAPSRMRPRSLRMVSLGLSGMAPPSRAYSRSGLDHRRVGRLQISGHGQTGRILSGQTDHLSTTTQNCRRTRWGLRIGDLGLAFGGASSRSPMADEKPASRAPASCDSSDLYGAVPLLGSSPCHCAGPWGSLLEPPPTG